MYLFLSDNWFEFVEKTNEQYNELHLPPNLHSLILNITIYDEPPILLHLKQGKLAKYHDQHASATISTNKDTLHNIIKNKNTDSLLEAFMTGQLRVDGDMNALLNLKISNPSTELKALYKAILNGTEFVTA